MTTEGQAWLPGMEPQEVEARRPKRLRQKRPTTEEVVPLIVEWVPGFKTRVLATVVSEKSEVRGRRGRRWES